MKNDNVGKCGHARCAGGDGTHCYEKGQPMRTYQKNITMQKEYNDAQKNLLELWKCIPMTDTNASAFIAECIDAWDGYENMQYSYPAHQLRTLEKKYNTTIAEIKLTYL